ncbi:hypothetical protein [Mesorhizobium onobrychidis]|uniref:Uncharacterized protein n=1 Tax=Mesorhizobium onobrychidis TaxID=2775404 RepID=A0ABY5R0K9_9HYPH|nr:hypothetical protein [Mesorhizobium onobrychidis]UVC17016.1 hypothetical protein IHQ72_07700 [Mesorhizobium onobrychidis]
MVPLADVTEANKISQLQKGGTAVESHVSFGFLARWSHFLVSPAASHGRDRPRENPSLINNSFESENWQKKADRQTGSFASSVRASTR